MPAVEPDLDVRTEVAGEPTRAQALHPCGPARTRKTGSNCIFVEAKAECGGDRGSAIDDLVWPNESRHREVEQSVLPLEHQTATLREGLEMLAPADDLGATFCRHARKHKIHLGRLACGDAYDARLHDAGLLRCDLLERVPELVGMVHRDRRDDGDRWLLDDVRRVEPPAQSDLEQQHIGGVFGEGKKSRRRGDLEEGNAPA